MATAVAVETKPEAKVEAKPESKEVEDNSSEPLKYKTWVLKVSIHCEGCKRTVKTILQSIEGVYTTNIDLKQQRVTVTGDVDAETLIKKLTKKGKRAELWPEKEKKKKSKGKNNKEKQSDSACSEGNNNHGGGDKEKEKQSTVKVEVVQAHDSPNKNNEGGCAGKNGDRAGNVSKAAASEGGQPGKQGNNGGGHVKESKPEVKTVTLPAGFQSAVAEKNTVVEIEGGADNNGGGGSGSGGGKKKKKKGQKGNNNNNGDEAEQSTECAAPTTGSPTHPAHHGPHSLLGGPGRNPAPANHPLPRHHEYQYPPPQYHYSPPVYVVGYNTAHPTSSYTTSYYASPPPYTHSHSSVHYGREPSPYYYTDSYSSQPSDSFELFSDENPNGCSVM